MMKSKRARTQAATCVGTAAVLCVAVRAGAAIQYDVVTLSPGGLLYGVDHGVVVGESSPGHGATVWLTPNQFVGLNPGPNGDPMGYSISYAYGISGIQAVGDGQSNIDGQHHALLWTSPSSSSVVDLNPGAGYASIAHAVSGNQQVGTVNANAALWTGTAASWVNLGGYVAMGVSDGTQVGIANSHAVLWHGTAASMVDLNPPQFTASQASGISLGQTVGVGYFSHFNHALLWTGPSASSVVDLNGQNLSSAALATNGVQQVGYVSNQVPPHGGNPTDQHAVVPRTTPCPTWLPPRSTQMATSLVMRPR